MPQRAKALKCLENEQSSINFYIENTLHFKIFIKKHCTWTSGSAAYKDCFSQTLLKITTSGDQHQNWQKPKQSL